MKDHTSRTRLIRATAALVLLNAAVTLLSGWGLFWWAMAAVNFVLLVVIAESAAPLVPGRHLLSYERTLAVGFPLLLLLGWELLVAGGILSPDWFPPPTRIA